MIYYVVLNSNPQVVACDHLPEIMSSDPVLTGNDPAALQVRADMAVGKVWQISKLTVLRRLIALNRGTQFVQMLAADPLTQAQWDAASVLQSDDPMLQAVRPAFVQALGLTQDQADALLARDA